MLYVQAASAVVVQYTTSGVFTSSGNATITSNTGGGAISTINFISGAGLVDIAINGSSNVSLGHFDILAPDLFATLGDNFTDTFTLTVNQTLPTGGSDTIVGQLTGNVYFLGSSLVVDFGTDTATINPVTYDPTPNIVLLPNPAPSGTGVSSIEAVVTVAPVPAAAYAGMALCGMIGVGKLRRKATAVAL